MNTHLQTQECSETNQFTNEIMYNSPQWREKRTEILDRDKYRCQLCGKFNPNPSNSPIDNVFIQREDEYGSYMEVHNYDKYSGEYRYTESRNNITIQFNFGIFTKIVIPTFNVHHKLYIQGREFWDYDNDQLITLCQDCHIEWHEKHGKEIPIMQEVEGELIQIGHCETVPNRKKIDPKDINSFKSWTIVKETIYGTYEQVDVLLPNLESIYFPLIDKLSEIDPKDINSIKPIINEMADNSNEPMNKLSSNFESIYFDKHKQEEHDKKAYKVFMNFMTSYFPDYVYRKGYFCLL